MTQTTFDDNVLVDGSRDVEQLRVQGHTTQSEALQTWEDNAGDIQAQITGDGRFIIGDDITPDALIEAHRLEASMTKPKRGFHSLGQIGGTLNSLMQWIVGELELRGSSAIDALHTALRIRASNMNTGSPTSSAELRAVDIEVINDASAGATALPKATGLKAAVTNASGKTITDAAGVEVNVTNGGTITNAYGLRVKQVQGTNKWGVYVDDANASNYLAGNLKVDGTPTFSTLSVNKTGGFANAFISGDSGQVRQLLFRTGASLRWALFCDSNAEAGSNTGSDFWIGRFDDAGAFQSVGLGVKRSTGDVSIAKNLLIGTTPPGTSGNRVLVIANGTTPTSSPADAIQMYATGANSELEVRDELGNVTTLSSHLSEFIDILGRPSAYVYKEQNVFTGKKVEMDVFGALEALEALTGKKFIYTADLPTEQREDWDTNEQLKVQQRKLEIEEWQHKKRIYDSWQLLSEAERAEINWVAEPGPQPEPYIVKPKPAWMDAIMPGKTSR